MIFRLIFAHSMRRFMHRIHIYIFYFDLNIGKILEVYWRLLPIPLRYMMRLFLSFTVSVIFHSRAHRMCVKSFLRRARIEPPTFQKICQICRTTPTLDALSPTRDTGVTLSTMSASLCYKLIFVSQRETFGWELYNCERRISIYDVDFLLYRVYISIYLWPLR